MLNLLTCSENDVNQLGQSLLYTHRNSLSNFEMAAQLICETLCRTFTADGQNPLFALFRVYRIGLQNELPPDVRVRPVPDAPYWLALAGTYGLETVWQHRSRSKAHKAISEVDARSAPMFRAGINQIHLTWGRPEDIQTQPTDIGIVRYFYVPEAAGSPYILDQSTFVQPYNIRTVIGIGCVFMSGAAYIAFGFTRALLDQPTVEKWMALAPHLSTLLAAYDQPPLWN